MVVIDLPSAGKGARRLRVSGHAGMGDKGSDPVCGAVSALVLTYLGGLETTTGTIVRGTVGDGECDVELEVPGGRDEVVEAVTDVFRYGFRRLAETYPRQIQIRTS
jgi:uncharacterized protein